MGRWWAENFNETRHWIFPSVENKKMDLKQLNNQHTYHSIAAVVIYLFLTVEIGEHLVELRL